ncbi:MAG: tryptophan-rich sensory protein [Clostridia bacterium]|nr:tryptophan-rich sensory protein [Clostridia bacterium]
MKKNWWNALVPAAVLTALTAGVAMLFTDTDSAWYRSLVQPSIQPPPWVFILGWTLLYVLCAWSLTLAIRRGVDAKTYGLFALQAVCNILWCLTYFTLHLPWLALFILAVYLVAALLTMRRLLPISPLACWLLAPLAAWLVFAGVLNYLTILLN